MDGLGVGLWGWGLRHGLEFGVEGVGCRVQGAGSTALPRTSKNKAGWAQVVQDDLGMDQRKVLI